jgi:glycosyltransferase involved in cell wall biosynthesis
MRKKVVFVLPSLRGGGAERVIVNIVRNLDCLKFDIRLILLKKEGPYISLLPKNLQVVDLDTSRVKNSIIPLIKAINAIKPDVVFSTMGHLNLAILAVRPLLSGNPKIIVREANTPSKDITKKKKLFALLYKLLYPKADLIIAQCSEMKEDLKEYSNIDESKIRYIYNPLDVENIKNRAKGKNPYDPSKINILSVGRLSPQKGFDILINAFGLVLKEFPNAYLTILGEGNLKEELRKQAKELKIGDNISFVGFKDNPYPYYYSADMYVLSSRWEGFPNTLLEALACKTKVIATKCKSGPKEILGENEFGYLVEVEDYESLAEGIINYIPENNKTGNRASFYDVNSILKEYEEILLS